MAVGKGKRKAEEFVYGEKWIGEKMIWVNGGIRMKGGGNGGG